MKLTGLLQAGWTKEHTQNDIMKSQQNAEDLWNYICLLYDCFTEGTWSKKTLKDCIKDRILMFSLADPEAKDEEPNSDPQTPGIRHLNDLEPCHSWPPCMVPHIGPFILLFAIIYKQDSKWTSFTMMKNGVGITTFIRNLLICRFLYVTERKDCWLIDWGLLHVVKFDSSVQCKNLLGAENVHRALCPHFRAEHGNISYTTHKPQKSSNLRCAKTNLTEGK